MGDIDSNWKPIWPEVRPTLSGGKKMDKLEAMAKFALGTSYEEISEEAKERLKLHLFDTLICAIGAQGAGPVEAVRGMANEFGTGGRCTLIGGGSAAPDRAALVNTAHTRYLDFMDNFLGAKETCHPCDNVGAVLAATEYARGSGADFLAALAAAYQIQCRLAETSPVMKEGFDHTTHLALSVAAGASRAMKLNPAQTANAIACSGNQLAALVVVRASPNSQLKGLASALTASWALQATFLATRGITGPIGLFECPKGYPESLAPIEIDWEKEKPDVLPRCLLKRYNAEVHTQSTLEATLEIRSRETILAEEIEEVKAEVFRTAYDIVGNGEYGSRHTAHTKEQADHSLPYLVAVALLDGDVMPEQFRPERIESPDVQELMKRVTVEVPPSESDVQLAKQTDPFTEKYPDEMRARVTVTLKGGRQLVAERKDYHGFRTRPFDWSDLETKFERIAPNLSNEIRGDVVSVVRSLDRRPITDLTDLFGRFSPSLTESLESHDSAFVS
ncbi:2-methylcitrate dehydratase [Fimbriimonas ginsengisoli Gsoil 348]|uniref:2-methylcitrate dehydratase n=1 Tax=Fimbriimonas ginsengisoli Gsoil 348 TaxID=661478 RepID=A0A068NNK5_FIMGI|nr:2-methylcitrate dehydratase [Fimbriimonas ginsengisoli Gsoil 348]